ncbi:MAG: hypothetical protein ACO1SV_02940 [Fimbriimonas sp.]
MRSVTSLVLMLAATAFIGGCASSEAPDEKAPEKPKSKPYAPPTPDGGPAKAPPPGG